MERFGRVGADDQTGADWLVVEQWTARQLRGDDLEIVPGRQLDLGDAHGRDLAVMAQLAQSVSGQLLDVAVLRLVRRAVDVLIESEIGVTLVGLWIVDGPGCDLAFVDQDSVRLLVDPSTELVQRLVVGILADAGVGAVVPVVEPADQVVVTT